MHPKQEGTLLSTPLKIIFAGTPDFAAKHLDALIQSEHQVVAVYTQPDRPAGRGKKLQASAVKHLAIENQLDVYQPESLKSEDAQGQLADLNADIMIVVAYGLILPQKVLDIPKLGCLNVHGSLLPRWRGAAPIQRAIWAGDTHTGVTIMQMDKGLDTGAMLLKRDIPIEHTDTSATLYDKLSTVGPQALIDCLNDIDNLEAQVQDDGLANYAQKLSKEEAKIDWSLDAAQLERNVRAFNPWPVAFFHVNTEQGPITIKVWSAEIVVNNSSDPAGQIIQADKNGILVQTGTNAILLTRIQVPGKKPMPVADILNARKAWFENGCILP